MIRSWKDLQRYLNADRDALGRTDLDVAAFLDDIWRFQRTLRYLEYASNAGLPKLVRSCLALRYRRLSRRLGFTIPINVFGPGLSIAHPGTIIVNKAARIGAGCRLHACVVIGGSTRQPDIAPHIGDRCYIGPGAKIYGAIELGDDVVIGANAVVNSSFPDGHVRIAGVPARELRAPSTQDDL